MCFNLKKNALSTPLFLIDDAKVRNYFHSAKHFPNFFSFYPKFFHFLYKKCTLHTILCNKIDRKRTLNQCCHISLYYINM